MAPSSNRLGDAFGELGLGIRIGQMAVDSQL